MTSMNLRRIRELRGLKQAELAELIGVDAATVSRAESMHSSAKIETYQKCAVALGVTLSDIFSDTASPAKRELLAMIDQLPDDAVAKVVQILQMVKSGVSSAT